MIGLEYIVKEFHMSLTDVASLLGISRKSISNWTKGWQPIPKKHLGKLSEYFGLEETLFQKVLTEEEKLDIQLIKVSRLNFKDEHLINKLNEEIEMEKLFAFFKIRFCENDEQKEILRGLKEIFERSNSTIDQSLLIMITVLKNSDNWGGDQFYGIKNTKLAKELLQVLKNNYVI